MTGKGLQRAAPRAVVAQRPTLRAVASPYRPVLAEFQPDAVEIEERTPPRIARSAVYLVLALIVAAVGWASLSKVDTIVAAQGRLIGGKSHMVVQPLETAVIRAIHVKVGDVVSRGQTLATLDPTFSQADVDEVRARFSALDAASRRLQAELDGRDFMAVNADNSDDALQARLFAQRKAFYDTSLRNYDAQIASAMANLQASADEESLLNKRLQTLGSIETMRQTLADRALGSQLNLLLSRDARLEVEDNLSRVRGNRADFGHRLDKIRADRQAFIDDFRRKAYQELVDTLAKRSTAMEDLKKAERRREMITLTAPADAVVLEIANRSVGSVVREAETLFVLVPRNVPLQAQVDVDSKDIGDVAVGQKVRLKFDAFPFQKYGTASGLVRVVSQDSFAPDDATAAKKGGPQRSGPLYYRVLVDLNDTRLRGLPQDFRMIPGMTLTAEMNVGRRRVISYFIYPLIRGLDESLREP